MDVVRINFQTEHYGHKFLWKFLDMAMKEVLKSHGFDDYRESNGIRFMQHTEEGRNILLKHLKDVHGLDVKYWEWVFPKQDPQQEHVETAGCGFEFAASPALTKVILQYEAEPDKETFV